MPRSSRAQAQRHHEELIKAASQLLRERDVGAVSLPDIMGAVGLTQGGFYKHFESKEALVGTAVRAVFDEQVQNIKDMSADNQHDWKQTREAFIDGSLCAENRDNPGCGCPSGLVTASARDKPDGAARTAYVEGLKTMIDLLAQTVAPEDLEPEEAHDEVLADLAILTGAVLLSRATAGDELSDQIFAATRRRLNERSRTSSGTSAATSPPPKRDRGRPVQSR